MLKADLDKQINNFLINHGKILQPKLWLNTTNL